jgi:hypothetical protein
MPLRPSARSAQNDSTSSAPPGNLQPMPTIASGGNGLPFANDRERFDFIVFTPRANAKSI